MVTNNLSYTKSEYIERLITTIRETFNPQLLEDTNTLFDDFYHTYTIYIRLKGGVNFYFPERVFNRCSGYALDGKKTDLYDDNDIQKALICIKTELMGNFAEMLFQNY